MSDITDNRGTVDNTDSPITKKLLNLPGQSVDAKLQDFAADHFLVPLMIVGMLLIVCATEWIGYFSNAPRNPWGYSAMLVVTVAVFAARWRKNWAQLKALKLGREGERAMAEYMNTRLDSTARVFHDVPIAHGNVDHVIICARGIYAVETKTRSKPLRRGAVVSVTSDHLKVDGFKPDRDPLSQAREAATDLQQILKTFTRKPVWVTPIVVFPGWSIADHRESRAPVWILSAADLAGRIARESETLTALDVARLSHHLTRYIRASK
jgi:Nuclease-related domain